ncbi:MAG TPA: hypothetical protein VKA40_09015 [Nitrososphaera sp.]|nr:hypothetical protein [Nitrososphaera sp.]HKI07833.1 hypothetical protein [Nitrososphaeraceae archaeon]
MAKPIDSWETIAKASELPSRSMKHVECKGKEIAIINLDGKYYGTLEFNLWSFPFDGHNHNAVLRR